MFDKPPPEDKPTGAAPDEPGRDTLPATFGSRQRTRAAREAARAAEPPAPGRPAGGPPDVTRWVALVGAGAFVVLFLTAAALFVVAQFREQEAPLPTPFDPLASPAPVTEAAPSITVAPENTAQAETATPQPTPEPVTYVVRPGDVLENIAAAYGVTVEEIIAANPEIVDANDIRADQVLVIPITPTQEAQVTPPPTAVAPLTTAEPTAGVAGALPHSIVEGDLESFYPLTLTGPRVTIHYQPGSFTDLTGPDIILNNAEMALGRIEERLGVEYSLPFDLYLAGSFFEGNLHLRGRAFSTQQRAFVLYDGSGNPAERLYMLAHEMTHVVGWNTYGIPSTVMLAEGLATYSGEPYLVQGGFIAPKDFCRALAQLNRLPSVGAIQNSSGEFQGHILNLYNYYTAACFVGYLFERAGPEAFAELYPTSNYTGNFGVGLGQLELDFRQSLADDTTPLAFDPKTLLDYYDEVIAGYQRLLANANPDREAYITLDRGRLAVVSGDFSQARSRLDEFKAMLP